MRTDLLMILLALALVLAMILTLLFGREYSRHGYGVDSPSGDEKTPLFAVVITLVPVSQLCASKGIYPE